MLWTLDTPDRISPEVCREGRIATTQEGTRVLDPRAYDALVDVAYRV